ncbi:unnamed protein product [Closterium sp. NIES-54]
MYRLTKGADYILLIVYVDDLLYIGSIDDVITWFEGELQKDLTLTVSSTVTQYLGLNIREEENAIYLNAEKYADTIAKRFSLSPTVIATPYRHMTGSGKGNSAPLKAVGIRDYQRKLGCLLFAAVTCRPDLSYSASQLATYLKKPEAEHMAELDRALHYFVSTPMIGLTYYKGEATTTKLIGYVDADHAGDSDNRRSRTGYVYRLEPIGPISWQSSQSKRLHKIYTCEYKLGMATADEQKSQQTTASPSPHSGTSGRERERRRGATPIPSKIPPPPYSRPHCCTRSRGMEETGGGGWCCRSPPPTATPAPGEWRRRGGGGGGRGRGCAWRVQRAAGRTGKQGSRARGAQRAAGRAGRTGQQGARGKQGSRAHRAAGQQGARGAQSCSARRARRAAGQQGAQGAQGCRARGAHMAAGRSRAAGRASAQGSRAAGRAGRAGLQGAQGSRIAGCTGLQGARGAQGSSRCMWRQAAWRAGACGTSGGGTAGLNGSTCRTTATEIQDKQNGDWGCSWRYHRSRGWQLQMRGGGGCFVRHTLSSSLNRSHPPYTSGPRLGATGPRLGATGREGL